MYGFNTYWIMIHYYFIFHDLIDKLQSLIKIYIFIYFAKKPSKTAII